VVRDKNQAADALSKIGSTRAQIPHGVFVQDLVKPSIKEDNPLVEQPPPNKLVATVPSIVVDWHDEFIKYLTTVVVPHDRIAMERLIRCSKQYLLVDSILMRKNAKEEILMKCVSQEDRVKLLHEIHVGTCGNHAASRTLVGKAF
jgi:hypothetical protein